jgi:predicted nucleic acid-binding protein
MIAAAALSKREVVATRNLDDFQRFVPHGLMLEAIPSVD